MFILVFCRSKKQLEMPGGQNKKFPVQLPNLSATSFPKSLLS